MASDADKPGPSAPKDPPAATAPPPVAVPVGRRAEDHPVPAAAPPKKRVRKSTENVIGAFLLAILVGGAMTWTENGRCPGALRAAFLLAAPLAVPVAVVLAGLIANAEKAATREERISRGIGVGPWAAFAATFLLTGMLLVLNERGSRNVQPRRCLVERRETVPARTAGVGEWVLVLRCSEEMSPVRVDVDRRTWWANEAGGTVEATVARGRFGFEWVMDTELGPPMRGFTNW